MADIVLGLAKSAVEGTLTMAKSAIEEEKKFKKGVQRDLMLISDEFQMMHSFLNVTKERATDDMTRTLVRQVRNMALDVEDCIESGMHLDNSSTWWRKFLPSCILDMVAAPSVALDDAVAGIELLKSRVEAMGQRNMRYRQIGDSISVPSNKMYQQVSADATALDVLTEARDAKMKRNDQIDLEMLINKNDDAIPLQVICVWGAGSHLGVASIIKKTCDNPEICKTFRWRAWVKLVHPFNPRDFIQTLLAQFNVNYSQGTLEFLKPTELLAATEGVLFEEFMKQVSNHRYLIVLENISTMVDWEAVRVYLPNKNNGSCIIVHTQQLEVASLCVGPSHQVLELERFSDDHSVCVFFNENREGCEEKNAQTEAAKKWLTEFKYVGRQTNLQGLRSVIPQYKGVMTVFGIAGVGKSSLVKQVYCEEVIKNDKFEKYAWIDVSHPFNLREFSRTMVSDLKSGYVQHANMMRMGDPIQECCRLLRRHKCLIVINGLQSTEEWDMIKAVLPLQNQNPTVVITHEESVAAYCCRGGGFLIVEGLEIDEALDLFKMRAGMERIDDDVVKWAKLVLQKCGGLPRVIAALADVMARQARRHDPELWSVLSDRFMEVLETDPAFGSLRNLFAWVHAYFHSCPDFLKPCIFYLSIFPLNHSIRRRRLVRRWVAEGYSRDTEENTGVKGLASIWGCSSRSRGSTAEETAEQFFLKLFGLSMIQVPGQRTLTRMMRMPLCQVNGFLREYMISRSMEENLVFALEGRCSMNAQRTGRHLAIGSTWDRDRTVFESIEFSRLRSLTVFGKWEPFFISDKMRLLRVLDLEDVVSSGVTNGDIEHMVKLLPRLKFLSLRGCKQVSRLPDSLGGLRQLQTLDIRHTSVVNLPQSITKLQKLQYIRAGSTVPWEDDSGTVDNDGQPPPPSSSSSSAAAAAAESQTSSASTSRPRAAPLFRLRLPKLYPHRQLAAVSPNGGIVAPRGIGLLTALHTLGVLDVSVRRGKAILEEVKKLTQLRKVEVSGINQENCQELCSAISDHGYLESLSVRFHKENNQACCLDGISPPPQNLVSLKLYGGAQVKLPIWMPQLPNLSKLKLEMAIITEDGMNVLGDLPKLGTLSLCFKEFQDGKLLFQGGFRELQVLEIACNSSLRAVIFDKVRMISLELLKLRCYSASPSLQFTGLEELKRLREVWLNGSYNVAMKQHLMKQLAEHPGEVKPVLMEKPHLS